MGKIWWSEMELFNRLLQLARTSSQKLRSEREQRAEEKAAMQQRIDALEAELADLKAARGAGPLQNAPRETYGAEEAP